MNHVHCLLLSALFLCPAPRSQETAQFAEVFGKALQYKDDKGMDRAVKTMTPQALTHFEALVVARWGGDKSVEPTLEGIRTSWARVYENATVLEKVDRWVESQSKQSYDAHVKICNNLVRAYAEKDAALKSQDRAQLDIVHDNLLKMAGAFEQEGHHLRAAETWVLDAILMNGVGHKTVADRQACVVGLERFLEERRAWDWTRDTFFVQNEEFYKSEKGKLQQAEKDSDKRKSEGYDPDARGIDALVMPGTAEEAHELEFAALKDKDLEDLDYGPRNGPVPSLWWEAQFAGPQQGKPEVKEVKLEWFSRGNLLLIKTGGAKFLVTPRADSKAGSEVEAGGKPKIASFFLDDTKNAPYAMAFWTGTDKERFFEADLNLQWSDAVAPVFYRSAASWHAAVGGEVVTLYDDSIDGLPGTTETWKREQKLYSMGEPAGTLVPELDSMRIGKGPRIPYSEFAQVGGKWVYLHCTAGGNGLRLGTRPFNPEWFKTGKVKLHWDGPKPSAPHQLVIQGRGTLATAYFEVAGGRDVEVPVGEYEICLGRIVEGKGARVQTALITKGTSPPFKVEEGKTFELKMGAPFRIDFERGGSGGDVVIEANKIALHEHSGALLGNLFNMVVVPEVLAAKTADGKGARPVGKFVKMTDAEIINKAAAKYKEMGRNVAALALPEGSRDGSLELKLKVPADQKIGLQMKQHPLFGKLDSDFK